MTLITEPGAPLKLQKLSVYGFCSLLVANGQREVCGQMVPRLCHQRSASPEERKVSLPVSEKPKDTFLVSTAGITHPPLSNHWGQGHGIYEQCWMRGGTGTPRNAAMTKSRGKGHCAHTQKHGCLSHVRKIHSTVTRSFSPPALRLSFYSLGTNWRNPESWF